MSKAKSRTPHVALLFIDGRMNIYELNSSNQHLEFRWNITIRTPKDEGQYSSCPLRVGKLRDWPPGAAFNKNLYQE